MRGEIPDETTGGRAETDVEHAVDGMNGMTFRSQVNPCASKPRLFPQCGDTGRAAAPSQTWNNRPGRPTCLRLDCHCLLNRSRAIGRFDKSMRFGVRNRPGPGRLCNLRLNHPLGDPCGVRQNLSAQDGCARLWRWRHDGEKIAHPIERHQRYAMRSAEPHSLDGDETAPTRHDDSRRMLTPGHVFQAALAIEDNERAALDPEAGIVGACRDDRWFDLEAFAPIIRRRRVGFRRWFGCDANLPMQQKIERRTRVGARGCRGVVFIGSARCRLSTFDRLSDSSDVEHVAARSCHASPSTGIRLRRIGAACHLGLWTSVRLERALASSQCPMVCLEGSGRKASCSTSSIRNPPAGERTFEKPFKAFSNRRDAGEFAASQVREDAFKASVYEVAVDDARKAIAAVMMGEGGAPVDIRTRKTTPGVDRLGTSDELGF